jgi:hypothetical protein
VAILSRSPVGVWAVVDAAGVRFPINAVEKAACPLEKQNADCSPRARLFVYLLTFVTSDRLFQKDWPNFLAR